MRKAKINEEARLPIFARRFRKLRGDMTQVDFAEFLGLSRPTIGFYENGERLPDALTLRKIAERCGVTADWLLGLTDQMAIDALRVQQKPVKLDRNRWDGCQFCKFPFLGKVTVDMKSMCENEDEMHLRRYNGNLFYLVCIGDYGYEYEVPVFNCPWCGRPLTEEAWAELERRINDGTTD